MRTSLHHQSDAQPPNGPLTAATSPDTPSTCPASQCGLCGTYPPHTATNTVRPAGPSLAPAELFRWGAVKPIRPLAVRKLGLAGSFWAPLIPKTVTGLHAPYFP